MLYEWFLLKCWLFCKKATITKFLKYPIYLFIISGNDKCYKWFKMHHVTIVLLKQKMFKKNQIKMYALHIKFIM